LYRRTEKSRCKSAGPAFTDPVLTPQVTFIKAAHINELCVAVAFLE